MIHGIYKEILIVMFRYVDKDVLLSPFIITYNIDWYTMYTLKICRILEKGVSQFVKANSASTREGSR